MRLTLRTLLAWLDDTLPAAEVKQIGKQVAESPYAQELVDRTYRVTRQRRLLVPANSGPDAIDPNLVAEYLDNHLTAEQVADYEKKCLTSDVALAEVASVHQILSLIGQKAKVPTEAKNRMYRLIKGRESAAAAIPAGSPKPATAPRREPITPPIASWSTVSTRPSRPIGERVGIAALVIGLVALISWTAYTTLNADPDRPQPRQLPLEVANNPPPADPKPVDQAKATVDPKIATTTEPAKPATDPSKAAETKPETATAPAKLTSADTLALGLNTEKGEWVRLDTTLPIKDNARLLNLAPYWSTFQVDSARAVFIGETEATLAGRDRRAAIKLGFDHGRIILSGGPDGLPYIVTFAGKSLQIANAPGVSVGLERQWTPMPGVAPGAAPLFLFVPEGEVVFQLGEIKESVKGPAALALNTAGSLDPLPKAPMPAWLSETGPSPVVKELGERLLKDFTPKGSVLRDLVQAVDGDDQDVRRLAIRGLGAVGDAEMIVPVLNNDKTDAGTRRAAADVLRSMLARGGDTAKAVRSELAKVFGDELGGPSEKMLAGFSPDEAKRESTYADLVRYLSSPELGSRELALHALMALTGRDNLEYDPTKPEGRGLSAWKDLLHKKELQKAAPPAPPAPR
jgi:hypothetical protein